MERSEEKELAFFGRITAGVTHEMQNVLAIIRESSGLMDDLLSLTQQANFPYQEKFKAALSSIEGQVRRGIELSKRLNRFAHSPDMNWGRIDLNEAAEQMVFLCQRFARLKHITLEIRLSPQPVFITGSPVRLQLALFTCLEACWTSLAPGGKVFLSPHGVNGDSRIRVLCEGNLLNQEDFFEALSRFPSWKTLKEMVAEWGGKVERDMADLSFSLIFPKEAM
jgi:hypothetical protein